MLPRLEPVETCERVPRNLCYTSLRPVVTMRPVTLQWCVQLDDDDDVDDVDDDDEQTTAVPDINPLLDARLLFEDL